MHPKIATRVEEINSLRLESLDHSLLRAIQEIKKLYLKLNKLFSNEFLVFLINALEKCEDELSVASQKSDVDITTRQKVIQILKLNKEILICIDLYSNTIISIDEISF